MGDNYTGGFNSWVKKRCNCSMGSMLYSHSSNISNFLKKKKHSYRKVKKNPRNGVKHLESGNFPTLINGLKSVKMSSSHIFLSELIFFYALLNDVVSRFNLILLALPKVLNC